MIVDLFLLAACGGVFSVPLYAIIQDARAAGRAVAHDRRQQRHERAVHGGRRGRRRGAGRGRAAARPPCCTSPRSPTLLVALWIVRILPHEVYRALFSLVFPPFHRVQVRGLENYQRGRRSRGHRGQPPVLSRCLPDRGLPAGQSHLRDPHGAGARNGTSSRSSPRSRRSRSMSSRPIR